jgi:hypothetical protein
LKKPAKSGPLGSDWVTVPPKKFPKQVQSLPTAQVPVSMIGLADYWIEADFSVVT